MTVNRRKFLGMAGWVLALPSLPRAAERRRRIGMVGANPKWNDTEVCLRRLREMGFTPGENLEVLIEYSPERLYDMPRFARELVTRRVEVIIPWGVMGVLASREATATIPIVMVYGGDPVGLGFVSNLARPGGNVTGLGWGDEVKFVEKPVELVTSAMPGSRNVAIIWNVEDKAHESYRRSLEEAARAAGLRPIVAGIRERDDLAAAFLDIKARGAESVVVLLDHLTIERQKSIESQASFHRLPIFTWGGFGYPGAVVRFGPQIADQPRKAAEYVARILRGAKPGNLPVERSTKYELVVNMKAAHALGLAIPETLLLRADRVVR